jgi:hypothetical protein
MIFGVSGTAYSPRWFYVTVEHGQVVICVTKTDRVVDVFKEFVG